MLWAQVEAALSEGQQVWLRSPLLSSLADAMGHEHDGRRWLVLNPRRRASDPRWARPRDVVLTVLALIALSPLLAVMGLLVKLTSPGPVFYVTTVLGQGRRSFTWRKFRSMFVAREVEDVEQRQLRYQAYVEGRSAAVSDERAPKKVIDERRVTPVGRFIRRYSIDELPQLWNVLRGEMSLVGPRPCLPYEAEFYSDWQERRFGVRPGLTGLWQVFGRGRVGFDEGLAMDVYYRHRRSLGFDLYLTLKTVGVVLTGRGAQ